MRQPDAVPPLPRRRGTSAGNRETAKRPGRSFAARLVAWQARAGRRDLPWQADRDPYRVWLAEVMLQQTQVSVVIPYFIRFCRRFPSVDALAAAPLDEVLALWAGLGYYARARNLHACARRLVERHGGTFPLDAAALAKLPGIGRSTAGAIAAFCADAREPILDGNVRRVLMRHFGIDGDPASPAVTRHLWQQAAALLPASPRMSAYTQAIMDLGATVCTRRAPSCGSCPVAATCVAYRTGRVDELPAPRRRRPERTRRAWALLALHDGRVLLQRRAPAGVWGGMHSLPQFDSMAALRQAAAQFDPEPRLQGRHLAVPGDLSGAAFFLVAAALVPGSELFLPGVGLNGRRRELIDYFLRARLDLKIENETSIAGEPRGDLRVRYSPELLQQQLPPIRGEIVANLIDEIPVLAVLDTFNRANANTLNFGANWQQILAGGSAGDICRAPIY